jgi:hypothetical protein
MATFKNKKMMNFPFFDMEKDRFSEMKVKELKLLFHMGDFE